MALSRSAAAEAPSTRAAASVVKNMAAGSSVLRKSFIRPVARTSAAYSTPSNGLSKGCGNGIGEQPPRAQCPGKSLGGGSRGAQGARRPHGHKRRACLQVRACLQRLGRRYANDRVGVVQGVTQRAGRLHGRVSRQHQGAPVPDQRGEDPPAHPRQRRQRCRRETRTRHPRSPQPPRTAASSPRR